MNSLCCNKYRYPSNVVQPEAETFYLIRAPKISQVKEITARVDDVAKGAALTAGVNVEIQFVKVCANLVPNRTLTGILAGNLQEVPAVQYTEEEISCAKKCRTLCLLKTD